MPEQETYDRSLDAAPAQHNDRSPIEHLPNEPYYHQQPGVGRQAGRRRLGVALLLIGIIWLAIAGISNGPRFSFGGSGRLFDATYASARQLEIDVPVGAVEVQTWDGSGIAVEVEYRGGSEDDYAINVSEQGDTVRITGGPKPSFFLLGLRDVQYRIRVPAQTPANIKTVNGDVTVEGLGGSVSLHSTNGAITADTIRGELSATTVNGEIELQDVTGSVNLSSTNGEITLQDSQVSGAEVQTTNGSISLDGIADTMRIRSINGDISVEDATNGQFTITTTNGDIEYEGSLDRSGSNTINTVSGDVTLRLPDDSSFTVNANTVSGNLSSSFELGTQENIERTLTGSAGGGDAGIEIITTNGDVSIERD